MVKLGKEEEKVVEKFKLFYKKYLHNAGVLCFVLAFGLNLFIESFARHSLANGLLFFTHSPLVFMYNVLIIFATLSIGLVIKRRVFTYIIVAV